MKELLSKNHPTGFAIFESILIRTIIFKFLFTFYATEVFSIPRIIFDLAFAHEAYVRNYLSIYCRPKVTGLTKASKFL